MENQLLVVEENELTDCLKFEQLSLIGEVQCETIALKTIVTKPVAEW